MSLSIPSSDAFITAARRLSMMAPRGYVHLSALHCTNLLRLEKIDEVVQGSLVHGQVIPQAPHLSVQLHVARIQDP